jgi:tellurite resistance protein TerA
MMIDSNKITLAEYGDSHKINFAQNGDTTGEIVVNLNWTQNKPQGKGFLAKLFNFGSAVDLDLGCFYELNNGRKSVIDGLQFAHGQGGARDQVTKQGCYTRSPWIWHGGDDRSGEVAEGENMLINPLGLKDLKRITVYCYIYDGAAKWANTNAVVTVKVPNNPQIAVEMGQRNDTHKFCAIAEILFGTDRYITVRKLVTFHEWHGACDKAYNWGMNWRADNK